MRTIANQLVRLVLLAVGLHVAHVARTADGLPNPFFAMDTGTRDVSHKTPGEQATLVKEIGFDGVGPIYHTPAELQDWFATLDKQGLKMFALYVPLHLDRIEPCVTTLKDITAALRGRDTLLWLYVTDKNHKASATDNDETAVKALRDAALLAKQAGLRIAIYPHTGFYVQRVEDAVRLVEKAGCNNMGVTFNLCHWLKVDGKDLEATLQAARLHLFCVTINGADDGGKSWKQLIQPLGRGTYDVERVLRSLKQMKYAGPIGLQHYGVGGDARENLRQSMEGWKRLSAAAAKE